MKIKLNIFLSIFSVFFVFIVMCALINSFNSQKNSIYSISKNKTKEINIEIKDALSDDGKEKFGEYGIGYYNGELSESDLINIYNNQIKDTNLNWVTLRDANNENKGYVFSSPHKNRFRYGTIDEKDRIRVVDYVYEIVDNSIETIRDNTKEN